MTRQQKKSDLVKKENDVVLQLPKKNNDEKKMSNTSKPRCLFDSLICSKFSENGAIMGKSLVQKGATQTGPPYSSKYEKNF